MTSRGPGRPLRELARMHGVQTAYDDATGLRKTSPAESVLATLKALGAQVEGPADVEPAVRARRLELAGQFLEPVVVVWAGNALQFELRVPAETAEASIHARIELEDGEVRELSWRNDQAPVTSREDLEGRSYVTRSAVAPGDLPLGYHQAVVEADGLRGETTVISAPRRAVQPEGKQWGVFLPLYALRTSRTGAHGDFTDLHRFRDWAGDVGADMVGTLPLLPAFLDEPFDPSPYAPVSRLLWNELYVDPVAAEEFDHCNDARNLVASPAFRMEIDELAKSSLVDYKRAFRSKRAVLEHLTHCCVDHLPERRAALKEFVASNPEVQAYARFRAACDQRRTGWQSWPEPERSGRVSNANLDADAVEFYEYAQWLAYLQVAREGGAGLYMDLPLGVHSAGFDTWRYRDSFGINVAAGAPPDIFFTLGQNWGFSPLHPDRMRHDGYSYFRAFVRHHTRHASMLRIDHVMGLHRLYWIPEGVDAQRGAYVRYRSEEMYAILALESVRSGAVIVGEDLGTVPGYIPPAMRRHAIIGMYATYFSLDAESDEPIAPPHRQSLACINTHDMPTLAAFWSGADILDRLSLSLLSQEQADEEMRERSAVKEAVLSFLRRESLLGDGESEVEQVLRGLVAFLAASDSRVVLINMEDMWLETEPQNVPGTGPERPNWQRKARYSLEEWQEVPGFMETLDLCRTLRANA
ncbi:MAG: 4-alpha-glucanotransferase [Dehalococcoidia bacterium]